MTTAERIARIVVNTPDVDRLAAFYVDTLDFTVVSDARDAVLDLGGTRLVLRAVASRDRVEVPGWSPWFQHCAIAVTDMDAAMARLRTSTSWSAISTHGPERLPPNTGGVTAFKFRDPDGHPLELLDLHASAASELLFLRIDHTAISVTDVERSVAFYEGLGLQVAGRSVNRGVEQERLDAIDGAVVDVVTLQTTSGASPHLELLGYRGSHDRPSGPLDADAVGATRTVFASRSHRTVRDPDGHALAFDD